MTTKFTYPFIQPVKKDAGLIILIAFLCVVCPLDIFSQSLSLNIINKGIEVSNYNDSVVIFGNVKNTASTSTGNSAVIQNDGHFYISGDWSNDDNNGGKVGVPGRSGWIHLDSAHQTISGNETTLFNNLELSGNNNSTKTLDALKTEIDSVLALKNHEFEAQGNEVHVLSVDTNAITRTTGFVSATDDGGLARNTYFKANYFFPVGAYIAQDTARFRPVDIKPNVADTTNTYKVRMANFDPDDEGFPRTQKDLPVGDINNYYYHRIYHLDGETPIDITVYYDSINDLVGPDYDILAYWADISGTTVEWYNPGKGSRVPYTYADTNHLLSGLRKTGFNNFNPMGANTPVSLSHNVDLKGDIFVANVFSPNGDGFNDFLFARARGLEELLFIVYDRWGEKIFETQSVNGYWDGTYKGAPLPTGVYVYVAKGKFKSGDEVIQKGNVTLLR